MSVTLYLLRHGETTYSRTGGFCGALDPELTDNGAEMARQFAAAYASLPWEAVYASPMRRTLATARPLCDEANLTPQIRDGLREIGYGAWEGRTAADVALDPIFAADYARWEIEPAWNPPTEGETASEIAARTSAVVTEVLGAHSHGNVLIVSHKATIRVLLCALLGIDLGRYRDRLDAPAGSLAVVRFTERGPLLMRLGDRAYMSDALRALPGS